MSADRLTPDPLLIGVKDAARLLGIGERLLWSMSTSGELPSVRVGRRRLYSVETLRNWIAEREREGRR